MTHYVSMQQSGLPFSFTDIFSDSDAGAILAARIGQQITLERGAFGTLFENGDFVLTARSAGDGQRMYDLNHAELCRQLIRQDFNSEE